MRSKVVKTCAPYCTVETNSKRYRDHWTGPEVSRRFRLPDFKTVGT